MSSASFPSLSLLMSMSTLPQPPLAGLAGVRAQGTAAGLHLTVWLPHLEHSQEQLFCHRARHAGLGLSPLGPCYAANTGADRPAGVVMGFAALDPVQIELGVRRLEKQLRQFRP